MDNPTPDAADANQMQFDQAEFAAPTASEPVCVACHQTIPDQYFQINGQILCESCSSSVKASLSSGSPIRRFLKAKLFGFGAAVAGFAIYYGVLKLTGLEIGLISILVGYMVGAAVHNGSEGRGGVLYQLMAVFFTYLAIAVSYSALVIPQIIEQIKAEKAAIAQPDKADKAIAKNAEANAPDANAKVEPALPGDAAEQPHAKAPMTAREFALGVVFVLAFMFALPVIAGFSQPIGLLIVAFALWEAFKMNRKINVVITGPHQVGPSLDRAPAHA